MRPSLRASQRAPQVRTPSLRQHSWSFGLSAYPLRKGGDKLRTFKKVELLAIWWLTHVPLFTII